MHTFWDLNQYKFLAGIDAGYAEKPVDKIYQDIWSQENVSSQTIIIIFNVSSKIKTIQGKAN